MILVLPRRCVILQEREESPATQFSACRFNEEGTATARTDD
jgi:hypothetical protein